MVWSLVDGLWKLRQLKSLLLINGVIMKLAYIANQGSISVRRPDVVMFVEISVGGHIEFVGGIEVGVASVTTTTAFVKTCFRVQKKCTK